MAKFTQTHNDMLYKDSRTDPYAARLKVQGESVCTACGAHYNNGRWQWEPTSASSKGALQTTTCPACQRIANNAPAGFVSIDKEFFAKHRQEVINLVQRVEAEEKSQHPMERLIAIQDGSDAALATTTGVHLANRIAHALTASFKGKAEFQYDDAKTRLDVYWLRD